MGDGKKFDALDFIMAYEGGEIETEEQMIEGFQGLVNSGVVWSLQGHYGRLAAELIHRGLVTALPVGAPAAAEVEELSDEEIEQFMNQEPIQQ